MSKRAKNEKERGFWIFSCLPMHVRAEITSMSPKYIIGKEDRYLLHCNIRSA